MEITRNKGNPNQFRLSLTIQNTLQPGAFNFNLKLYADLDGESLPPVVLPVSGFVVNDIQPVLPFLTLPGGKRGNVVKGTIAFQSHRGNDFSAHQIHPDSRDIVIEKFPSETDSYQLFEIMVTISNIGNKTHEVHFTIIPKDEDPYNLVVPVSVYGFSD